MSEQSHPGDACGRIRERLPAFLAGETADSESLAIARHLEECAACAAEAALEPEIRLRLDQGLLKETAPAGLQQRIRAGLGTQARTRRWPGLLAAAAVLFVLLNGVSYFRSGILPHEFVLADLRIRAAVGKIHELLGVGLGDHLICAVYRRLAPQPPSEEETAEEMGADWAPLAEIAARYAPPGFEVRLAHRCRFGGREFIHVALFDGQQLASLIVTRRRADDAFVDPVVEPTANLDGIDVYSGAADDFGVSAFETEAFLVFLVSDLSAADQAAAAAQFFPPVAAFLAVMTPTTETP